MTMRKTLTTGLVLFWLAFSGRPAFADPPDPKSTESATKPADGDKGPVEEKTTRNTRDLALEHSRLRNELLAVESRLSLLSEKVFTSRLEVRFRGDLDRPFSLARLELYLDGSLAYRQEFNNPPSVQALKLFDGYLTPGQHQLQLHLWARSPGESQISGGGYFAGSGMVVLMRKDSDTRLIFEADQDGDALSGGTLADSEPEGCWNVEVEAHYETQKRK